MTVPPYQPPPGQPQGQPPGQPYPPQGQPPYQPPPGQPYPPGQPQGQPPYQQPPAQPHYPPQPGQPPYQAPPGQPYPPQGQPQPRYQPPPGPQPQYGQPQPQYAQPQQYRPQPSYAPPYGPPRGPGAPGWPTAPPGPGGQQWTGFPAASPTQVRALHNSGHAKVLRNIVIILVVLVAVVAVLGKATTNKPVAPNCQPLTCVAPPIGHPIVNGQVYTSSQFGFTVQYNTQGQAITASSAKGSLTLTFSPSNPAAGGQLQFAGVNPQGSSASAIVSSVQQQVAPNATQAYVVPGAYVGYQPGYGAAYDVQSTSSDGSTEQIRIIILAAVRNNLGIVVIAAGPYLPGAQASNATDHPTPVDMAVAISGDPYNNSVRWPGEQLP